MTGIGEHRPVFHHGEVLRPNDVLVTRDRNEDITHRRRFGHGQHPETIHRRFEGFDGVNFGDDNIGTQAPRPEGGTFATPAIASDDHNFTSHQDIRGADDPIKGRLTRAVAVIKKMLRFGIVDVDGRKGQHTIVKHRLQADNAGGGFFGGADNIGHLLLPLLDEGCRDITTVINDDLGAMVEGNTHMAVIGGIIFALDRIDRDAVLGHQVGGHIILG